MKSRSTLLFALALLVLPSCDGDSPVADSAPSSDAGADLASGDIGAKSDTASDSQRDAAIADVAIGDAPASTDAKGMDTSVDALIDASGDIFAADAATSGRLNVLSYNVAGLPGGLSKSDPVKNTPQISPLLNAYDLALMQEDFAFTTQLSSKALHPYKSPPGTPALGTFMNDGLTRFSNAKFSGHTRIRWKDCNGIFDQANDCLASKGFSVAKTDLGPGVSIDVYNLHMDAGNSNGDLTARAKQVDQLLAEIAKRSAGRAIIVAGDTNIRPSKNTSNKQMLDKLMLQAKLTDACVHVTCGDADRIDRVLYRSSATVKLEALTWKIDKTFVDSNSKDLSDHEAVGVLMSWSIASPGGG